MKKYVIRFCVIVALVVIAIVTVCWFAFGKVVEATLTEEICKWVFGTLGVLCFIIEPIVGFIVAPLCYHLKYKK